MKLLGRSELGWLHSLLVLATFGSSCQRSPYFVEELSGGDMARRWVLASVPAGVPSLLADEPDCWLNLKNDQTFETKDFPLVTAFVPHIEVKYVSESGTWDLIENSDAQSRARWKVRLLFPMSRFETSLDVVGTREEMKLFQRTDLDWWVGFKFVSAK